MTEEEWLTATDAEVMTIKGLREIKHSCERVPAFLATFGESGRIRQMLSARLRAGFDQLNSWAQGAGPHPSTIYPEYVAFDLLRKQRISTWHVDEEVEVLVSLPSYCWWSPLPLLWFEACNQPIVEHHYRWQKLQPDAALWLRAQAERLREVVGNPFRPATLSPAWRTSTATTLARQMYESWDFSLMPILADALQDAGCEDEQILSHYRDADATHVGGCWVVDLVLGK